MGLGREWDLILAEHGSGNENGNRIGNEKEWDRKRHSRASLVQIYTFRAYKT